LLRFDSQNFLLSCTRRNGVGLRPFQARFVDNLGAELTGDQLNCLHRIDETFALMDKDSFSPEKVSNSTEWQKIRELVSETLKAFGWPLDDPPRRTMSSFKDKESLIQALICQPIGKIPCTKIHSIEQLRQKVFARFLRWFTCHARVVLGHDSGSGQISLRP
jgi:hypothetical protein